MRLSGQGKNFLFLQGPHGPWFHRLARMLRKSGATCWRVGFNRGDRAFWHDGDSFIPFRGQVDDWPATLDQILTDKGITDLVLYGDTRPIHARAVEIAKARGLTVHVFDKSTLCEEDVGYPSMHLWSCYE